MSLRQSLTDLQRIGCPESDGFYQKLIEALEVIRDSGYAGDIGPAPSVIPAVGDGQPEADPPAAEGLEDPQSEGSQEGQPLRRGLGVFTQEELNQFTRPAEQWCVHCLRAFDTMEAPCMDQAGPKATACRRCRKDGVKCDPVSIVPLNVLSLFVLILIGPS